MSNDMQHNSVFLSIQEVKTCLRTHITLTRVGLGNTPVDLAVAKVRAETIAKMGVRRYLFDMLGDVANLPAREVCFLDLQGEVISLDDNAGGAAPPVSLVDYLEQHFTAETLPVRILLAAAGGVREFVL